jgi:DNA-binding NarL/FixJ family response regulator
MTVIESKVNVFTGLNTQVLDDDQETNDLLKEIFFMNGMPNVAFFTSSDMFLDSLNENVHLCIVDENIKGSLLQGLDVMEIIRGRFPECQIIFFSGTDDPIILKKLIKLRPEGYVDKDGPNYLNDLVKVVEKCLVNIKHNLEFVQGAQRFLKRQAI